MRLHVGFYGLTQNLHLLTLPAEIWKTCNCIVLPLLWDLFEDVNHSVLFMCTSAVQEGTQHCYQVAIKVIWKIIFTNTLQRNSHPTTWPNLPLQRRCAAWCSLQGKLLEDKMPCSALKAVGLAACWWFLFNLEDVPCEQPGLVPSLAIRKDSHAFLVGWGEDTEPHRRLSCPFALISTVLDATQPLMVWTTSKMNQKKAWILLLLQIYFSSYWNVLEIVDPHCQTWGFFSKKTTGE